MTGPPGRLAACYIRVSTEEQTEYSPDAQLREINEYAGKNHLILLPEHIYLDAGLSAKKAANRPAFQRMIAAAKSRPKQFDVLLVYKFSRFARNREDSIVYKNMLRNKCGISVISIKEPLDDENKMSILMESVIEAMDEFYSLNLAEDVRRDMGEKHLRGELQTTPAFGFRAKDNMLVPREDEAPIVREIFQRFVGGAGYRAIAAYLNGLGVRTRRGNKFANRTVEYIIRNPVYIGLLRRNPQYKTKAYDYDCKDAVTVPGKHQALVAPELWEAAQRRARELKELYKPYHKPAHRKKSWLSGLLVCSSCGGAMYSNGRGQGYTCGNYARGRCASAYTVKQAQAEQLVLSRLAADAQYALSINYTINSADKSASEYALLAAQKKKLLQKAERLREAYLIGVEDLRSYTAAKQRLKAELAATEERLQPLLQSEGNGADEEHIRRALASPLLLLRDETMPPELRAEAAARVIEKIVFNGENNSLEIYYRYFFD